MPSKSSHAGVEDRLHSRTTAKPVTVGPHAIRGYQLHAYIVVMTRLAFHPDVLDTYKSLSSLSEINVRLLVYTGVLNSANLTTV